MYEGFRNDIFTIPGLHGPSDLSLLSDYWSPGSSTLGPNVDTSGLHHSLSRTLSLVGLILSTPTRRSTTRDV